MAGSTEEGLVILKRRLGSRFYFRWHVTEVWICWRWGIVVCCYFILSSGLFNLLTFCSASLTEVLLVGLLML